MVSLIWPDSLHESDYTSPWFANEYLKYISILSETWVISQGDL